MSYDETYSTAFPFNFSRSTRGLFPPTMLLSLELICRIKSMTSHPLLRNLDTLSHEYRHALMVLSIMAADAGAVFEKAYHCFAHVSDIVARFLPRSLSKGPGETEERWGYINK